MLSRYLLLLFFSPLLMFLIHTLTGRIHTRLKLKSSPLVSAVWAVTASFLLIAVYSWNLYLAGLHGAGEIVPAAIYGTLVLGSLGGCYYILFAMTEAARRIKIMEQIYLKGPLTPQALERDYGASQMLAVRLERLISLGQLEERSGRYFLKGRLLYYVSVPIAFWARLLKFSEEK